MSVLRRVKAPRRGKKARQNKQLTARQCALVAERHLREGSYQKAGDLYRQALKSSRPSSSWFLYLAQCEFELNRPGAARSLVQNLTRRTYRMGRWKAHSKKVETTLKAYPRLRAVFYEAMLEYESRVGFWSGWARALSDLGQFRAALRVLLKGFPKAGRKKKALLPDLKRALKALGEKEGLRCLAKYERGKLPEVPLLDELRAILSAKSKQVKKPTAKRLSRLVDELEEALGGGEPQDKSPSVQREVDVFLAHVEPELRESPKTRLDLAIGFWMMGLGKVARRELRRIPPEAPCFLEARCVLGEILFQEGAFPMALGVYQRVVRDKRASTDVQVEAKYQLAEIWLRLGQVSKAARVVKELVRVAPDYRQVRALWYEIQGQERGARAS